MKKYTQPTVEITAFDFEDITMSSLNNFSSEEVRKTVAGKIKDEALVVNVPGNVIW